MTASVRIGERTVGAGAPVLVVAEVGVNHDGDLATALELVEAAAKAGAGAVKFQTFDASQLATPDAELASYQRERGSEASDQRELLTELELGSHEFEAIAQRCSDLDLLFLSTPFDSASAKLLATIGVPAFKVGSGELTNLPFLEELAGYGLPLLVSTGMASLEDVDDAVAVIRAEGAPLVLLHCVSSYPAPAEEANLRALDTLRAAFDVPVGYSDHCLGLEVSLAAVARDACLLERHFTLDKRRVGPDHAMSLEPPELAELIHRVSEVEEALGSGRKEPQPSEVETRTVSRRSVVAARPLQPGDLLSRDAVAFKRPGDGIAPGRVGSLIGRRMLRPVAVDEQLREADLEERA
jgi:N-acetylneuraminate synthase